MTSSNVLLFSGRTFDTTKFRGHSSSNREVTRGRGVESAPPPALPDSEKPVCSGLK